MARLIFSFDLGRRRSRCVPFFFLDATELLLLLLLLRSVLYACCVEKHRFRPTGTRQKGEGRAARRVCVCPPRRTESLIPFINAVRDRNSDIPSRFLVSLRASCEFYKKRNKRRRDLDWLLLYFFEFLSHTLDTHPDTVSRCYTSFGIDEV